MAGYRKTIIELADTTSSVTQGGTESVGLMEPRIWLKAINDAAKKQFFATQFVDSTVLKEGQKDIVVPKRRKYIGSGSFVGTAAEGSAVNYQTLNNLSGVSITPTRHNAGIALTNHAVRTNNLNLVKHAREELTYMVGDEVDKGVFDVLKSDSNRAKAGTLGSQAIYGGDAKQSSELGSSDTITTDHIAKAKRYLQSTTCKYWTYGTGESNCSEGKNPWTNTAGEPFVLFIAPEQEETFLIDSQFVNASEYGSDKVIKNGEIGEYLGIKIVVSPNTPSYDANVTHADGQTTAVAQHRCIMMKAKKAAHIAWGQKPRLVVFDYPSELEKRLVIEQAYKAEMIHPDSIVHINVADE